MSLYRPAYFDRSAVRKMILNYYTIYDYLNMDSLVGYFDNSNIAILW